MNIRRVVPDIRSKQMDESRAFYVDFLGFNVGMDMGFMTTQRAAVLEGLDARSGRAIWGRLAE
jgi:hypothetical protein